MMSVTSSDDVSEQQLTVSPVLTPLSWQPPESRDSSDASYHAVLGLLLCSSLLVVAALVVYLCSVVRFYNHFGRYRGPVPPDDVVDHVTTPTAVTSVSSSARSKELDETGLLKSLIGTGSTDEAVTWYGSRDVEVGRPTNVRYISLRRCARQSSSVESESGPVTTPTGKRLTPLLPKRFGFVGWSRAATPPTSDWLRQQSSAEAATMSVGEDCSETLIAVTGHSHDRYAIIDSRVGARSFSVTSLKIWNSLSRLRSSNCHESRHFPPVPQNSLLSASLSANP